MNKRPWMAFYVRDFQMDTLTLSPDEVGVYMVLICLAWRRGDGSITGDMDELKITLQRLFTKFHGLTFNRIVPKLLDRYFEKRSDGRFYQERVEKELRIAEEFSEKQSRNAKERWSKYNKNNMLIHTNAMPSHSHTHTHKKGYVNGFEGSKKDEIKEGFKAKPGSKEFEAWKVHYEKISNGAMLRELSGRELEGRSYDFPCQWPPEH